MIILKITFFFLFRLLSSFFWRIFSRIFSGICPDFFLGFFPGCFLIVLPPCLCPLREFNFRFLRYPLLFWRSYLLISSKLMSSVYSSNWMIFKASSYSKFRPIILYIREWRVVRVSLAYYLGKYYVNITLNSGTIIRNWRSVDLKLVKNVISALQYLWLFDHTPLQSKTSCLV